MKLAARAQAHATAARRTRFTRQHEWGGLIYQQTFIDAYAKVAFAKLSDQKTPLTTADLLNDRVVPFCGVEPRRWHVA